LNSRGAGRQWFSRPSPSRTRLPRPKRVAILPSDSYNAIESMPCCRFILVPGGEVHDYEVSPGETYDQALLGLGIIPDTVLIFHRGTSLPQDKPIEEDEVEIVETCSRG
jgi:hypothetical protein